MSNFRRNTKHSGILLSLSKFCTITFNVIFLCIPFFPIYFKITDQSLTTSPWKQDESRHILKPKFIKICFTVPPTCKSSKSFFSFRIFYMNFYILLNHLLCATCPVHLTLDSCYFQYPIISCPLVQTHESTWNNTHKILVHWKNTFLNTAWNCSCCQLDTRKSSTSHPWRHFVI